MNNQSNTKDLLIAFLGGAIAGRALAYLVSTEQGNEIVEEIKEASKEKIQETKKKVSETEELIKVKLDAAIKELDIDSAIEKGKDTLEKISANSEK